VSKGVLLKILTLTALNFLIAKNIEKNNEIGLLPSKKRAGGSRAQLVAVIGKINQFYIYASVTRDSLIKPVTLII
jgi:hypothetical protein